MTPRDTRLRGLAWSLGAVAVVIVAGAVALYIGGGEHYGDTDPTDLVLPITFAIVGTFLATRLPRNVVGWLFLFMALDLGLQGLTATYAYAALVTTRGGWPGGSWALWADSWLAQLTFPTGAAPLLIALLPDGRLPSHRWRAFPWVCAATTAFFVVVFDMFVPGPMAVTGSWAVNIRNPIGSPSFAWAATGTASTVLWMSGLMLVLVAAAAPFLRMRHATPVLRQQLRWIAYAIGVTTVAIAAEYMVGAIDQSLGNTAAFGALGSWMTVVGYGVALPAATAIAVVKYRLYDIDTAINRTVVYGSLAIFITAVYVGIAVGIGTAVGSGGKPNLGLSIIATAIVAVGFQPVRERLQRLANRLVYGHRATPYQALAEFSTHVASSYATGDVLPRMVRVLAEATGAQRADVWLREGERLRPAAAWPEDASAREELGVEAVATPQHGDEHFLPLQHAGSLLGALSVTKRPGEGVTPVEEHLLTDLATQAGIALQNVRLAADLQERVDELRESRQRLVAAQDRERRRIERNLHDGAQQHLVALKVKLGLATMLAARDTEKAKATIVQLKGDADEALETLRDLARGIYPPLLAERGLATALEAQARKATLPVGVEADGVGRYDHDVEAAVYFCVLEALQNVQKYAHASSACVSLSDGDGSLHVTVSDDGDGFDVEAARRAGSGLTNMADRIAVIGGELGIWSAPGQGSRLTITVPAVREARAAVAVG